MTVGRPPMFNSPDDMQIKIDEYFTLTDKKEYAITGLARYLGFESRQSLFDYEQKDGFSYPIKRAKLLIEEQLEIDCKNKQNPTGTIFIMKNFGWSDKQEIEQTVTNTTPQTLEIKVIKNQDNLAIENKSNLTPLDQYSSRKDL